MIDNKTIRKVIMLNKLLPSGSPTYEDREASGAVANFTTNTVKPFVKCECTIDATESGTSVLNVNVAGKNIFDKSNESEQINGYISASKIIADNNSLTVFTKCKPNTTYTVSKTAGKRFVVCWYDDVPQVNDTLQGQIVDQQASSITITTGATAKYIVAFVFNASVDTTITMAEMLDSIQIEEGSTATTYAPYSGNTTTVTLEETAYGGSVDVIAGTGQIIDEHGNLVYTLFEPVSISALEGVNNVWCDTGDIEVTYKYKTGEGGSTKKKYLPIFYDFYGKGCRHL